MKRKVSEFNFPTPRENDSVNMRKEEQTTPDISSGKRKMSRSSGDLSGGGSSQRALGLPFGKSNKNEFPCKFCGKVYLNSQALGGHQNAHKGDRALDKAKKNMNAGRLEFSLSPYPNLGYFPTNYPNPMIASGNFSPSMMPSFPEPYHLPPTAEPHGFQFLTVNPQPSDAIAPKAVMPSGDNRPSNLILDLNDEAHAEEIELGAGSSNSGALFDLNEDANDVVNEQKDPEEGRKSLDLNFKLW